MLCLPKRTLVEARSMVGQSPWRFLRTGLQMPSGNERRTRGFSRKEHVPVWSYEEPSSHSCGWFSTSRTWTGGCLPSPCIRRTFLWTGERVGQRMETVFPWGIPSSRPFHSTTVRHMTKDPYEVLGVVRDATSQQIKEAFYSLAKKYHPDANKSDKNALAKFNEAREAYEILSNEDKRKMYDQTGFTGDQQGFSEYSAHGEGPEGFEGFGRGFGTRVEDIFAQFEDMVGGNAGRGGLRRGANVQLNMDVSFMDAARGSQKTVNFMGHISCKTCKGTGARPDTRPTTCHTCNGTGHESTRTGFFSFVRPCRTCHGSGTEILSKCSTCHGHGRVQEKRTLKIDIPSGVDTGTSIRFAEQGEPGEQGGPSGHLFVTINIEPSLTFRREGSDVYVDIPVSFVDAVLGGTVQVPTLDGMMEMTIPAGTQPGERLVLRHKGIRKLQSSQMGHQYVVFKVTLPKKITEHQKELLRQFTLEEPREGTSKHERGGGGRYASKHSTCGSEDASESVSSDAQTSRASSGSSEDPSFSIPQTPSTPSSPADPLMSSIS